VEKWAIFKVIIPCTVFRDILHGEKVIDTYSKSLAITDSIVFIRNHTLPKYVWKDIMNSKHQNIG